jgi:ankyrin repeat protein
LCPDEDRNTPFHRAAHKGHLEVVKFYAEEAGCDPNCEGQWEKTPLHCASQNGHLDVVKYLVDAHHCDPLHSDARNLTSLNYAADNGHDKVVDFFNTIVEHKSGFMQSQSLASSKSKHFHPVYPMPFSDAVPFCRYKAYYHYLLCRFSRFPEDLRIKPFY